MVVLDVEDGLAGYAGVFGEVLECHALCFALSGDLVAEGGVVEGWSVVWA